MNDTLKAYVQLLDESVDVWRPTKVRQLDDGLYQMVENAPSDERWRFEAPEVVRCEDRTLSEGPCLAVVARVRPGDRKLSSEDLANLIVDALVDGGVVQKSGFARAVTIAVEEIDVRKALGDY